jgi:hypothetical protein
MQDEGVQYRKPEDEGKLPLLVVFWLLAIATLFGVALYFLATVPGIWGSYY